MVESGDTGSFKALIRDPVVLALLVVHAWILALYLLPFLDPERATYALDYLSMIPVAALGILAPWVGLPPVRESRERAFWGLISGAFAVILAIRLIYVVDPQADSVASGFLATDLLYGAFYLLMVLAVTARPDRLEPLKSNKTLTALETSGTVVLTITLLGYFVFLSRSYTPEVYRSWVPSLTFYWVVDLLLLLTLLYLRATSPSPRWRVLYAWLALAPFCFGITDILEMGFYWMRGLGFSEEESWLVNRGLDSLWYLPWIALILAARMRRRPWPGFLARGALRPEESDLSRSLGRPGWLLLAGLAVAVVHLSADLLNLLDPATKTPRTVLALGSTSALVVMAFVHQRILARRMLDLTRRSRELEEHQRFLATAVEQSPDGILITDSGGRVRYANPAWRRGTETMGDPDGAFVLDVLPRDMEGSGEAPLDEVLLEGEAWDGKHRYVRPDGSEAEEIVSVSPVRSKEGEIIQWVAIRNDVTYLAQLERRLGQAQKMEALGTLAGGIAHDFNNLLGAIYGYGEILSMDLPSDSPSREDLRGILTAAERAAELVSQILTFSRQGEETGRVFLLGPVIQEALSLLKATLPSTIEIRSEVELGGCRVRGSRQQIHQMMLNLGTNAAQAMAEEGGILEVRLAPVELSDSAAPAWGLEAGGPFARLTVEDTGMGMERSVLDRIFDPFFTTKEVGKGTGLGLSVVHGAVTAHGGGIRVESEPGKGSAFEILLPCSRDETSEELEEDRPPPQGHGEKILVVDDESIIASLAGQMLEGLGYRPRTFSDSREALAWVTHYPDRMDAILTDQTMPGITGLEFSRRVRAIRPGLPVLIMTGYSELLSREALERAGAERVLMKPFNRRELGEAVAAVLDDGGGKE